MWMIFNQDGSFNRSISIQPHPNDVEGLVVVDGNGQTFDFTTKQYSLVDGEIVAEEYTMIAPPAIDTQPTVQQKLAAAGISIDELKQALGLPTE